MEASRVDCQAAFAAPSLSESGLCAWTQILATLTLVSSKMY